MIIENIEASLKAKMVANEKQLHDKDGATAKPDTSTFIKQLSFPTSSMEEVVITEPAIQRIRRRVWKFITKYAKSMNGGTIDPASNFKLTWDVIVFVSLAFYAVVDPMLSVMTRANISPGLFFVGYSFDAINWIDSYFYSTKFATYYNGHLLSTSDEIRKQYFKSGRFYIDLISEFPYDLIMWAFVSRHIIHVIRLVKLLKLLLLPAYIEQLEALRAKLHISNFIFRFVGITFIIVMIPYWVSIIFYAIAKIGQSADGCHDAPDYVISCSYRRTWIYQQMDIGKLPYDISGYEWTVLMRSFSWSISALTARMSDVRIVNAYECLFAFLVLFLGLVLNGKVIGNIMGIVIDANEGNTSVNRNIDILRSYLRNNKVPIPQIDKAVSFLRYRKTKQGSLTLAQDLILRDLPVIVQKQIDIHTKVGPYLRGCPIFDICSDEFLREISAKLRVQLYIKDDKLIDAGDIGYEMFFIEDGSVHVVSADGRTIYSTLEKGSFFGETALFSNANRTASIKVASSFCTVYILTKDDFHDELASSGIDAKLLEENFQSLQAANKKRNAAVTTNLSKAADPSCKLYRFLGGKETQKLTYLDYLRLQLPPNCYFRIAWNFIGMCFLLYYSMSIVFYMAFTFGSKVEYYVHHILWFDCLVDAYWIVDIVLKALIFPFKINMLQDQINTDGDAIWHHYRSSGHFYIDVIASIPLEFLNLILGVSKFRFSTRLIHLIRVLHLIEYFDLFEQHVEMILGWTTSHTSLLMVKASVLFLVLYHWLACGFFSIHRFIERHQKETYVTMDHSHICHYDYVSGTHDICSGPLSFCYVRSIFFVLSPFREITPWQNSEYLYQIFVTIMGAFLTAFSVSVCELYLQNNDDTGMAVYDRKIKEIEKYCKYRALKPDLQETILTQYNYNWMTFKSTRTNRMDLLDQLSPSCKIDITSLLQKNFIARTPVINQSSESLRRKISSFVRPQVSSDSRAVGIIP
jgi:CRP-like cAMP-binding protein